MWIFVKRPNKCRENYTSLSFFAAPIRKKMDKKDHKDILHTVKLKTSQCNVKKKHQKKDIQIQNIEVSLKRTNRCIKDEVLHDTSS